MNTAEIKLDLITRITSITDKVRLEELLELLQFQSDSSAYITNEEENKAISEAKDQISDGKVFSNEEVQNEINTWLPSFTK